MLLCFCYQCYECNVSLNYAVDGALSLIRPKWRLPFYHWVFTKSELKMDVYDGFGIICCSIIPIWITNDHSNSFECSTALNVDYLLAFVFFSWMMLKIHFI